MKSTARAYGIVVAVVMALSVMAATYGPTVFYGNVSVGQYVAISNLAVTVTSNAGTLGPATNHYRISGTNAAGRIPGSSNVVVTMTTTGNSVRIDWPARSGVMAYVVERSTNGSTWNQWASQTPLYTNFTDYGTNTWTSGTFTSTVQEIPSPIVPWAESNLQYSVGAVSNVAVASQNTNAQQTAVSAALSATQALHSAVESALSVTQATHTAGIAANSATGAQALAVALAASVTNAIQGTNSLHLNGDNAMSANLNHGGYWGTNAYGYAMQGTRTNVFTKSLTVSGLTGDYAGYNGLYVTKEGFYTNEWVQIDPNPFGLIIGTPGTGYSAVDALYSSATLLGTYNATPGGYGDCIVTANFGETNAIASEAVPRDGSIAMERLSVGRDNIVRQWGGSFGMDNIHDSSASLTVGNSNRVNIASAAIGQYNYANGYNLALGEYNTAMGDSALSAGWGCSAEAGSSVAHGTRSRVTGNYSWQYFYGNDADSQGGLYRGILASNATMCARWVVGGDLTADVTNTPDNADLWVDPFLGIVNRKAGFKGNGAGLTNIPSSGIVSAPWTTNTTWPASAVTNLGTLATGTWAQADARYATTNTFTNSVGGTLYVPDWTNAVQPFYGPALGNPARLLQVFARVGIGTAVVDFVTQDKFVAARTSPTVLATLTVGPTNAYTSTFAVTNLAPGALIGVYCTNRVDTQFVDWTVTYR